MMTDEVCPSCNGDGDVEVKDEDGEWTYEPCWTCDGRGLVTVHVVDPEVTR